MVVVVVVWVWVRPFSMAWARVPGWLQYHFPGDTLFGVEDQTACIVDAIYLFPLKHDLRPVEPLLLSVMTIRHELS